MAHPPSDPEKLLNKAKEVWLLAEIYRHYDLSANPPKQRPFALTAEQVIDDMRDQQPKGSSSAVLDELLNTREVFHHQSPILIRLPALIKKMMPNPRINQLLSYKSLPELVERVVDEYPEAYENYHDFSSRLHIGKTVSMQGDIQVRMADVLYTLESMGLSENKLTEFTQRIAEQLSDPAEQAPPHR